MKPLDLLELEIRRLEDVSYVGYADRPDALVVQVVAHTTPDPESLRVGAERVCRAHLDRPFVVELVGPPRPSRIRLLDVKTPSEDAVEVHLGLGALRTVGRAEGSDPTAAAV